MKDGTGAIYGTKRASIEGRSMNEDPEIRGRLTQIASLIFLRTEHAIYAALGLLLALTAGIALVDAVSLTWQAFRSLGGVTQTLEVVDRLLLLLMLIEILHTVRVSMRKGQLTCEPFLIVGLIASIRRVLVITLQSSEIMHGTDWSPAKAALFRASMIELGVLAGLILTMVISIFLLHRAREGDQAAGVEDSEL